ncbi:ribonuclease P protein component [Legionella geestiana]|nr:ribonuclease P protein component [Legionella geestiana]QBS12321.1 ribonuclease P protein component [Legionella geestiana]QDQ39965.1 ribonuclease P protein component [Legionella geestiana]
MSTFGKSRRLLIKRDFDTVFADAKKLVNSEFVVLYRENMLGRARLGMAISKKMLARAHERNRIKRLVREAFREASLPPIDLIFLARSGLGVVENRAISAGLGKLWKTLNAAFDK